MEEKKARKRSGPGPWERVARKALAELGVPVPKPKAGRPKPDEAMTGAELRAMRTAAEMTMEQVGAAIGVTRVHVWRLEHGKAVITLQRAKQLRAALGAA